jgi:hypothetical protein
MGKINDGRCLYFQDAQLELTGKIILSPSDLKAWIKDLSATLQSDIAVHHNPSNDR